MDDLKHLRKTLIKFVISYGSCYFVWSLLGKPDAFGIMTVLLVVCFFASSSRVVDGIIPSFKKLNPEPRNLELYWQKPLSEISEEEVKEYRRMIFLRDLPDSPADRALRRVALHSPLKTNTVGK